MKNNNNRGLLLGVLIAIVMIFAFMMVDKIGQSEEKEFYEILEHIKSDDTRIKSLTITGQLIEGTFNDGKKFRTIGPEQNEDLVKLLGEKNIPHTYKVASEGSFFESLIPLLSLGMAGLLIFLVIRQLQGASGKAMSFGKSRARMMNENDQKITFADVAGAQEAKEELIEIIEFLKITCV